MGLSDVPEVSGSQIRGLAGYDALLVVSFGGPEGPDDVMPFLENVTAGRGVPRERLELVARHYLHRGGISPINQHNRDLIQVLQGELADQSVDLPIYFGNRNWHPFLSDAVEQMAADGVTRAIAWVTSAFSSYSGCRQYRENIAAACDAQVNPAAPEIHKLRVFYDHPLFIETLVDNVVASWRSLAAPVEKRRVIFTAHSIPLSMANTSDYVAQLEVAADLVAAGLADRIGLAKVPWDLVFQSRSGPPQMPWLEPDIVDHIDAISGGDAKAHTEAVVVLPLGFMSDHMEVMQDLDTDAAAAAARGGLEFARAPTAGHDPRIARMIVELIRERGGGERRALGSLEIKPDRCAVDCCPRPQRPPSSR